MVEDNTRLIALPSSIGTVIDIFFLTATETYEANDIVGTRTNRIIAQGDTGFGGRLTSDGRIVAKDQFFG